MTLPKVLIVDDDKSIYDLLRKRFEHAGFSVSEAATGSEALKKAFETKHDAILLDIMLPDINGFDVCTKLRTTPSTSNVPILMLTVKTRVDDEFNGLKLGADDYITKPFDGNIVVERTKRVISRSKPNQYLAPIGNSITLGQLSVDLNTHKVTLADKNVKVTSLEFKILSLMIQNPGKVFSRKDLVDFAWTHPVTIINRAVDVHMNSIRKKLGPYARYLETVHGAGYRLDVSQ